MSSVAQHALCRAKLEAELHQLQEEVIECMNMKQKGLLAIMERKQKLLCEAPVEYWEKFFQEVGVLDDRISVEEADLFQNKEEKEEMR